MKMTPSKLLNIVLVTVLATSLFFISTTVSTAEYNPWSDIDGDGDIDIYDVVKVTGIYGSSGDPTRNVTVTNFPRLPEPEAIIVCENYTLPEGKYHMLPYVVNIEEYRYVSIFITYHKPYTNDAWLYCCPSCLNITAIGDGAGNTYSRKLQFSPTEDTWISHVSTNFIVGAPYLGFKTWIPNDSVTLTIVLYCYN